MKHFASRLTCAAMFAAMAPAQAADMPIKARVLKAAPYDSWTGAYIGGNAGYSWGDWRSINPVPGNTLAGIGFGKFRTGSDQHGEAECRWLGCRRATRLQLAHLQQLVFAWMILRIVNLICPTTLNY